MIDTVTDEMDVDAHLPAGGVLHAHYEKDSRVHGVDVWESAEALQKFMESARPPPTRDGSRRCSAVTTSRTST
jgi:hypothetical protein